MQKNRARILCAAFLRDQMLGPQGGGRIACGSDRDSQRLCRVRNGRFRALGFPRLENNQNLCLSRRQPALACLLPGVAADGEADFVQSRRDVLRGGIGSSLRAVAADFIMIRSPKYKTIPQAGQDPVKPPRFMADKSCRFGLDSERWLSVREREVRTSL